ncbi:MAG TPA: GTPase, partial [Bacillota bacterium]|nr:GTPase [Bacillota bacterium]
MIDPRPFAVGTIKATYNKYPHIGALLPAMGYSPQQVKDLEATINASDADVVVTGTPIDLSRVIKVNKPIVRISYELQEIGQPTLEQLLQKVL